MGAPVSESLRSQAIVSGFLQLLQGWKSIKYQILRHTFPGKALWSEKRMHGSDPLRHALTPKLRL